MGQGFSHMLQMMTNEFVKNVERNASETLNYNQQSHKNLNLNINDNGRVNTINNNSEKSLFGLSVNNKQQIFEDPNILLRKSGKIKLPLMSRYIKQKKIRNMSETPISDGDGENNEVFDKLKIITSPKIVKILKKKKEEINSELYNNSINTENNLNSNLVDKNIGKKS